MDQASQSIGRDAESKSQVYQNEVNEHREQLSKSQGEINRLLEELNQKEAELTAELKQVNSDLSARERVLNELKTISERKIAANKEKAEIQIRYLNAVIAVLERQAIDPEFAPIRGQIEAQIQKLRASRNEILASASQ
jgi:chromosome segregation ATPase